MGFVKKIYSHIVSNSKCLATVSGYKRFGFTLQPQTRDFVGVSGMRFMMILLWVLSNKSYFLALEHHFEGNKSYFLALGHHFEAKTTATNQIEWRASRVLRTF